MYFYFLIFVHVVLCVALICLVLLQQGKGADLGAVFGNSNSVFGAGGAGKSIGNLTRILAILFMVTSILLVREYISEKTNPDFLNGVKAIQEEKNKKDALKGSVLEGLDIQDDKKDEAKEEAKNDAQKDEGANVAQQEGQQAQESAKENVAEQQPQEPQQENKEENKNE